jgi:hypothetical protein
MPVKKKKRKPPKNKNSKQEIRQKINRNKKKISFKGQRSFPKNILCFAQTTKKENQPPTAVKNPPPPFAPAEQEKKKIFCL